MYKKGFANILVVVVVVALIAVGGYFVLRKPAPVVEESPIVEQTPTSLEAQIRTAVEKVLAQGILANPDEQMPKDIKLLSVSVMENKVTLNFSKEIQSKGQAVFEDTASLVNNAVFNVDEKINVYEFLIEGQTLDQYFPSQGTVNWKTYKDVNLVYQIQYPSTWVVYKVDSVLNEVIINPTNAENYTAYIDILIQPNNFSEQQAKEACIKANGKVTTIDFAGTKATQCVIDSQKTTQISVEHSGKLYRVSTQRNDIVDAVKAVSTFKFTK